MAGELTIPGGKEKGKSLADASSDSISYWLKIRQEELAAGSVEDRFVDANKRWVVGAQAEIAKRNGVANGKPRSNGASNGKAPTSAPKAAMVIAPPDQIAKIQGSYRDATDITEKLTFLQQHANLLTPTTACPTLPAGCAVALAVVHVDTRDAKEGGETYSTGGAGRGLLKSALLRISAAAGISFDSERCGRIDDGSDPRFVRYRAVAKYVGFDGLDYELPPKTVELDLNDDSDQVAQMHSRSTGGNASKQIGEMRLMLIRHAEGRAIAGVIRNLGMKTSYLPKELEKPFVVARLQFTGESDDPAIRGRFAEMIGAKMLGGKEALYRQQATAAPLRADSGNGPPPAQQLPHDAEGWKREVIDSPAETPALGEASGQPVGDSAPAGEPAANGAAPKTEGAPAGQAASPEPSKPAGAPSGSPPQQQPLPVAGGKPQREPGDDSDDPLRR